MNEKVLTEQIIESILNFEEDTVAELIEQALKQDVDLLIWRLYSMMA